jgi:hypothetical protein
MFDNIKSLSKSSNMMIKEDLIEEHAEHAEHQDG